MLPMKVRSRWRCLHVAGPGWHGATPHLASQDGAWRIASARWTAGARAIVTPQVFNYRH
jgi:hypothetical protein